VQQNAPGGVSSVESGGVVAAVQTPQQPSQAVPVPRSIPITPAPAPQAQQEPKKKGLFGRLKDIFK
jgi:hypothetical protein